MHKYVIIIALFFGTLHSFGQSDNAIKKRINLLRTYPVQKVYDSVREICLDIDQSKTKLDTESITKLKSITKETDLSAYIYVNAFFAHEFNDEIKHLNYAYKLASENNLKELMGWIQVSKSVYFKNNEQYDSSLVCLLKAKEHYKNSTAFDNYVAILHTIGDLYFKAGMYENAKELYTELLALKGERKSWNHWRERVIIHNLGLVALRQGHFEEAIARFQHTLKKELSKTEGDRDFNVLAYEYSSLAEAYFEQGLIPVSLANANSGINYALSGNYVDYMPDLYLIKSKCLLSQGRYDEALTYANLTIETFSMVPYSTEFDYHLQQHLSKLFTALNDTATAESTAKKAQELKTAIDTMMPKEAYIRTLNELSKKSNAQNYTNLFIAYSWYLIPILLIAFGIVIFKYYKNL